MQTSQPYSRSEGSEHSERALRVFLVEDSAAIRERLTETLSSLKHVQVAGHAETEAAAIAALQAEPCDAVVLDLQLRQGHGFNVLKALRGDPNTARMIVLVLTNHATPQYFARSVELGADHFFDKSREYDQLCAALEELAVRRTNPRRMQ
jgi:DNA-binding NarL/FixJ family response regulator